MAESKMQAAGARKPRGAPAARRSQPAAPPARAAEWLWVGAVLALTSLAFLNALDGAFTYDDRTQILRNTSLRSWANLPRMFTESVWQFLDPGWEQPLGIYYRPLFNAALIAGYQLFGFEVLGWHLASLLVHGITTSLVYFVARAWALEPAVAAAAALFFGLHPVHSESVAWISALPDPLAAVFVLASLLLHERHRRTARRVTASFVLGLLCAAAAMLSKEVALVYPLFLGIREWQGRRRDAPWLVQGMEAAGRVAPYLVLAVLYLGARYLVLGFIAKPEPRAADISGLYVLYTIPSILLQYARMLVVPYPLAILYDHSYVTTAADPRFWGPTSVLVAGTAGAAWLLRRAPLESRAALWLVLFLLPVLSLKSFNPAESLLHDRYLYLPSVGFCWLAALALRRLVEPLTMQARTAFLAATALVGSVLGGLTVYQNRSWSDGLAMADYALRVAPDRPFLHNYIGAYHGELPQWAEAERAYRKAIELDPRFFDAHANLGNIYNVQGRKAEAEQAYRTAIELGAPYAEIYLHLGVLEANQGELVAAQSHLLRAVQIQPSNAAAHHNLGWVYGELGEIESSKQAYREALRHDPAYPEPRINLGVLATLDGQYAKALEQLEIARRHAPDHAVLLYALGDVYMKTERYPEAIAVLSRLAERVPRHRLVHTSLGLCYEAVGDPQQARAHFERAIAVAPADRYTEVAREHLARWRD